ncbi:MAG TPA: FecR domain-containing protein [Chryseosolibacter sp.]|jgi:Fe2+-dicitrate sensor, membrane component
MKIDKVLLKKFYNNECTDDEASAVYRWLSDPANSEEVAVISSEMWDETDSEISAVPVDFDGLFNNILSKTGHRGGPPGEEKETRHLDLPYEPSSDEYKKERPRSFSPYKIAAGLVSILVISALVYELFVEDKYFIYSTAYGETKVITLPDGSDVTLNSNSTIKYAYNYDESSESNDAPREVFLDGEGFFNVKKRARPATPGVKFIVHANQVDVEVLGTSFNVNTRRGRTMVVLNSGMVRLGIEESGNRMKEMVMRPGELVEVGNTENEFVKRTVSVDSYSSWTHNKLVFDSTPVKDILNLIEDNFGYQVVLHDKTLENRLYTDTTPADDLDLLLSKLSIVYNLKVTRTDRQIIIQLKN